MEESVEIKMKTRIKEVKKRDINKNRWRIWRDEKSVRKMREGKERNGEEREKSEGSRVKGEDTRR